MNNKETFQAKESLQVKETLQDLRTKIDAIDSQIFDLIKTRLAVVEKVGAVKHAENPDIPTIIRPCREAQMVEAKLQQALDAGLPLKTANGIKSLWRSIISLCTSYEEDFRIITRQCKTCITSAREYFGGYSNITQREQDIEILQAISSGQGSVGVLDCKAEYEESNPWWLELKNFPEIKIIKLIPFFRAEGAKPVFVIAKIAAEPSGNDKFVYSLTTKNSAEINKYLSDGFQLLSKSGNNILISSDEFLNDYQNRLGIQYLGCFAVV